MHSHKHNVTVPEIQSIKNTKNIRTRTDQDIAVLMAQTSAVPLRLSAARMDFHHRNREALRAEKKVAALYCRGCRQQDLPPHPATFHWQERMQSPTI
jgi:hypothetical protein